MMRRYLLYLLTFLLVLMSGKRVLSQESTPRQRGFNLAVHGCGISLGNSSKINGLRFNIVDEGLKQVNGLNFTIWRPKGNWDAVINGVAIGLVAPEAGRITGISFGSIAVIGHTSLTGLSIGGVGTVSNGEIRGISFAGLGLVGNEALTGLNIAGVGAVSGGEIRGVSLAGIGLVGEEGLTGLNIGGIGIVSLGEVKGLTFGGLGILGQKVRGITASVAEIRAIEEIQGLAIAGYRIRARDVAGVTLSGLRVDVESTKGIMMGCYVKASSFTGLSVGAFNRIVQRQTGIAIGLVNCAKYLNGIQIGLLNYARNNPRVMRILPLVNLHFD